jgi:hypothetical protein
VVHLPLEYLLPEYLAKSNIYLRTYFKDILTIELYNANHHRIENGVLAFRVTKVIEKDQNFIAAK